MYKILALISILFAAVPVPSYAYLENSTSLYFLESSVYRCAAVLPATYFVNVIKESENGYSLVSYLDITGYVKTDEIKKVDYTPKYKYASARFTVQNDSFPANLRSLPDHTDKTNVTLTMPHGSGGSVIGSVKGTALIESAGDTWYYVRYEQENSFTYGYVYSGQITKPVFEKNTLEKEDEQDKPIKDEQGSPTLEMSLPVRITFISALCLPALFIMVLFFKKPKDAKKED